MTYDVVVAGAGPVGLMLAAELGLAGVSVLVLEKDADPDQVYKHGAMGARSINAPSSAAFTMRGLLPAVRQAALFWYAPDAQEGSAEHGTAHRPSPEQDQPARSAHRGQPEQQEVFVGHFAGLPLRADRLDPTDPELATAANTGGGGVISVYDLELLLAEHAEKAGAHVRHGSPLIGVTADNDGVTVRTDDDTLRAGWLVGCDGGRSTVRKLAGFDFPGVDPEFIGRQAIVDIADPDKLAPQSFFTWHGNEHGSYVVGGWGIESGPQRIHTVEYGTGPGDRDTPPTAEELQASLRRVSGTDVTITGVHVATRYTDRTRQATTYRAGRVLLAGDAAHVHSPAGGQGLNLGIGDAVNLGWKLAATVHGWAPEGLLDSYTSERHPLGAWVQGWSMAQGALGRPDPRTQALRGVLADLLDTPAGATYVLKKISGLGQYYDLPGNHPMIGKPVPELALDDGSTLAEHATSGTALLVNAGGYAGLAELTARWHDRLKVVTARSSAAVGGAGLTLVRPDGYIAWATNDNAAPATVETAVSALLGQ